ncbi:MAG: hypothetical protein OXT67_04260 [Zetaproteobacteria bacterium]|nr:hypothetical protein [Zetaproteobacteria bacterium]
MDLNDIRNRMHENHRQNQVIMTFGEYIKRVKANPRQHLRSATDYVLDTIEHFGKTEPASTSPHQPIKYHMFAMGTESGQSIIGGERAQAEIYSSLKSSQASPKSSKLLLLHGPNGSAKSSTVDSIAHGMQKYSETDEGAVYRFNWIFPTDRELLPKNRGAHSSIGFREIDPESIASQDSSFAHLEDHKIAARIISEFKESPLFLIPNPYRTELLTGWVCDKEKKAPDEVNIPLLYTLNGLSKKNYQIFQNLLNGYQGDLFAVLQHIQVERFYYSKRYRVGISTVEPQLSMDAREKQLTMDQNYANLPTVLHTISFHKAEGELVEANRGIIEFSDLLKRPVESFKYLISTIETNILSLTSGPAYLDLVYMATTNEKHLDSFKTLPDFSSFKGRMELITVPYLVHYKLEEHIYEEDILTIRQVKPVSPHALTILCKWAVMTRLRQPDPENYPEEIRPLISRLHPFEKLKLYQEDSLRSEYSREQETKLKEYKDKVLAENMYSVAYEGRFGASARELKRILYRIAQNPKCPSLNPFAVFAELEDLVADRSVYEFLQFEPRGKYHDTQGFIQTLKEEFLATFERELIECLDLADAEEYTSLLQRYVSNVVAEVKNEKMWDQTTNSYIHASQKIMEEIEQIIRIEGLRSEHRHNVLSRIAAYRIEQPDREIELGVVFPDLLEKIKAHYNQKHQTRIFSIAQAMTAILNQQVEAQFEKDHDHAWVAIQNLESRLNYDRASIQICVRELIKYKKAAKESQQQLPTTTPESTPTPPPS